jgi:hypothetical protein
MDETNERRTDMTRDDEIRQLDEMLNKATAAIKWLVRAYEKETGIPVDAEPGFLDHAAAIEFAKFD